MAGGAPPPPLVARPAAEAAAGQNHGAVPDRQVARRRGWPDAPDLEDMLRKGQDRFKRMMPGGFGGGRGLVLIIGALVLIWLATRLLPGGDPPNERGVVLRFERVCRTVGPGCTTTCRRRSETGACGPGV